MSASEQALTPQAKTALTRARWAVIQTGLITTGLALFGVYVLANRINEEHVMNLHIFRWFPAGAWIVGTIAGSGYVVASWWSGLPVRRMLLAGVLALQSAAYFAGHYTDLQSMGLIYRDTRESVRFIDYFHQTTINLAGDVSGVAYDQPKAIKLGYTIRAVELVMFLLGAACSGLVLLGVSRCGVCGGAVKQQEVGTLGESSLGEALPRMEHFAGNDNIESFMRLVTPPATTPSNDPTAPRVTLMLCRCKACGTATIDIVKRKHPAQRKPPHLHSLTVSRKFAEAVLPPKTRAARAM